MQVLDSLGGLTKQVLDSAGNVVREIDRLGLVTQHVYDALGRPIETKVGNNPPTIFQYDLAGNLLSQLDPRNHETVFGYDVLGRQTKVTDALQKDTLFTYDVSGNVLSVEDPLHHFTRYEYDGLNRKTKETFADPDDFGPQYSAINKFKYDGAGQLWQSIRIVDGVNELITRFSYYESGSVRTETQPPPNGVGLGAVTRYTYDAAGNRRTLTDPVGNKTTWEYDELNQVKSETNQLEHVRKFEYDPVGNLAKYTDREGRVTKYEYDELNRREKEEWLDTSGAVAHTINTTYHDSPTTQTSFTDSHAAIRYTAYDDFGRPTQITSEITSEITNQAPLPSKIATLSQHFDAAGNRDQFTVSVDGVAGFVND